jgi:HAD superfamily hydrolase (TIGR01544 family)
MHNSFLRCALCFLLLSLASAETMASSIAMPPITTTPPVESSAIETFFGHRVVFSDKGKFEQKLRAMKAHGPGKLSVVTDFDFTLSQFMLNGARGSSCHKVIEDCGLLQDSYHTEAKALQAQHYPVEVDPDVKMEDKILDMVEWVTNAHQLLVQSGLTKSTIANAVRAALKEGSLDLRQDVDSFFATLAKNQVPTLIFSAGIADVLEACLQEKLRLDPALVHVISNRCIFAGAGEVLTAFVEPHLHVFNKRCAPYLHTPFFQLPTVRDGQTVLLLGDSMGDVTMCEGMARDPSSILKVGFLNDRVERLGDYLKIYDLVILDDPGFAVPNGIIDSICNA